MKTVYLASPYSHASRAVMEDRHDRAVRAAAAMMETGVAVFCPIAHSHNIGIHLDKSADHDFWLAQDTPHLVHASEVAVLRIPGWDVSKGVRYEIELAHNLGIPVRYL